jgi:hypothetical protein
VSDVIDIIDRPLDWYSARLLSNKPFSLSRWGDGELRSVLAENDAAWDRMGQISSAWRKGKTNKSGHSIMPEMGVAMRNLLIRRPAKQHMLSIARRYGDPQAQPPQIHLARWMKEWLVKHKRDGLPWHNCDVIVYGLIRGQFDIFLDALRGHQMIMVGPHHLEQLKGTSLLPIQHFVQVPRRDAFKDWRRIIDDVNRLLQKPQDQMVVSISMGPAAALVVEALARKHGSQHFILDLGSIWDPFVGEQSRSYMSRPAVQKYVRQLKRLDPPGPKGEEGPA